MLEVGAFTPRDQLEWHFAIEVKMPEIAHEPDDDRHREGHISERKAPISVDHLEAGAGKLGRVEIEIGRAQRKEDAVAGLDRWKARHPDAAAHLQPADVLVDSMRGRSTTWTRIRLNLRHVAEADRPPQEALEVDYDPWEGVEWPGSAEGRSAPGRI